MGISSDVAAKVGAYSTAPARCKLGRLLGGSASPLSDDDYAALKDAIHRVRIDQGRPPAERYYTVAWLYEVLTSNGYPIGRTVVAEHIRKACSCGDS